MSGFTRLLLRRSAGVHVSPRARLRLLRWAGVPVGNARIYEGVYFGGTEVTIGDNVFVNRGVVFDNAAAITIGDGVSIGHDVLLCTSTHERGDSQQRALTAYGKPIVIEQGTWIGARAVILPGVTVGPGCVIAAGAVVASDCQADGVYGGVPARRIKDVDG